jgi:hypothetical protein
VDRKRCGYWLGAALAALLVTQEALAQAPPGGGMPKIPSREEVAARIRQVLQASPDEHIEIPGVCRITYKKVPTDPQVIAQRLGQQLGGQVPAGVNIDQYIRMYQPQITEVLNETLADLGKFEALVELKMKSKRIPVGEWKLGMQFDGERPMALIISGDGLERPIEVRLKTRPVDMTPELKIEFKTPRNMREGHEEFELQLEFMRFQARSKSKIERVAAGSAAPAATAGGDHGDHDGDGDHGDHDGGDHDGDGDHHPDQGGGDHPAPGGDGH